MRILILAVLGFVSACSSSPKEKAADAVEDAADRRADLIVADMGNQVAPMQGQADQLRAEAKTKSGYEGKILETRARALDEEVRIRKDQARAQADAARAEGDAQAKGLRAQ